MISKKNFKTLSAHARKKVHEDLFIFWQILFWIFLNTQIIYFQVAGVHIDGNGFSWLQMLVTDKEIKFIPFITNENGCTAKVFLVEKSKDNLDIGRALVGLGFARVTPFVKNDGLKIDAASLDQYLKQLKSSENRAKTLRKGLWSFKPENWFRWKARTTVEKFLFDMKPLDKKIPALIR